MEVIVYPLDKSNKDHSSAVILFYSLFNWLFVTHCYVNLDKTVTVYLANTALLNLNHCYVNIDKTARVYMVDHTKSLLNVCNF